MVIHKKELLKNLCYTELVYDRINKKLSTNYSKLEIEEKLYTVIQETEVDSFLKKGKNFYIINKKHSIRVTINSNTFRVITVDKIK